MNPDALSPAELFAIIRSHQARQRAQFDSSSVRTPDPKLSPAKRRELQAWAAKKRKAGASDEDINAAIAQKYGTTLDDIMSSAGVKLARPQLTLARQEVEKARAKGFSDEDISAYLREEYNVGLGDVMGGGAQIAPAQLAKLRRGIANARADGLSDEDINAYLGEEYGLGLADIATSPPRTLDARRALPEMAPTDAHRGLGEHLSTQKLTELRQWVEEQRSAGVPDKAIDAEIFATYRKPLSYVLDPTAGDYLRSGISGATFGLNDELGGLAAAAIPGGQGYKEVRDIIRQNQAGASYVAPRRMFATELVGGMVPALATLGAAATPGMAPAARALTAAKVGGGVGAASGFGHSEADSLGGLAKDTAIGGLSGAAVGAGLSGLGSFARSGLDRLIPSRPVAQEAAAIFPGNAAASIARQEALAPGTATIADRSHEMLAFAKLVGADRRAAQKATREAGTVVKDLEDWLAKAKKAGTPDDDPDVAFITERLNAAKAAQQTIKQSAAQHAAARAGGMRSASLDASILRRPSIMDLVGKLTAPSPERRARVVAQMLTSPTGRQRALELMAPPRSVFPAIEHSLLFGATSHPKESGIAMGAGALGGLALLGRAF